MDPAPDYIQDIEKELSAKSHLLPFVLWAIAGYLLSVGFDIFKDRRMIGKMAAASIAAILVFLAIPLAAGVLLKLKKKAGWIIGLFYFGFMTLVCCGYVVQNIHELQHFVFSTFSPWRFIAIFGLPSMITVFLLTADTRKYLSVSKNMFVLTLVITTVINLALVVIMLRS